MTKRYSLLLTTLFCAYIGGVLLVSILLPKQEFSQLENRYLQKPPILSVKTLQNGQFMQQAEDYAADHIVGRDLWVSLKAWSERLSGKRENNGVYFAAQDTLIAHVPQPNLNTLLQHMQHVNALSANSAVPVYFGLIPSAAAIWRDRLPDGAPTADELAIIDQLYATSAATTIDMAGALAAHSEQALYYRTDHHWTSLGAFYGANAILTAMNMDEIALHTDGKRTVTDQFYGTAFSSSGVRWIPPDSIDTYVSDAGISVTSYFGTTPTPGALYVDSFLEQKDKYSYFLGGNQPLCVIETSLPSDAPRVLVIRDSYADALSPFLTQSFSQIHLFDLRYNLNSVKDYVAQNDVDAVIVLYSFANFTEGTNLSFLAR